MSKEKAIELRGEGFSLNHIVRELKTPKTTVWGWIRHVKLTDDQQCRIKNFGCNRPRTVSQQAATEAMVKKYACLRSKSHQEGRDYVAKFEVLPADLIAGAMLYWAEGSKTKGLAFSNSNKEMVKFFLSFMVKHLSISPKEIKVHLCFYDNVNSKEVIEQFWLDFLGMSKESLYKSQINKRPQEKAGSKIGRLPFGVCTISKSSKYKRYELDGMIEAVFERVSMAA